jgi:hypothetical protein
MRIHKNFSADTYLTSVLCNKKRGLKGGFERPRWNDIAVVLVVFIKDHF